MLSFIFGNKSKKFLKKYHKLVSQINSLEESIKKLTDLELKEYALNNKEKTVECLAAIREASFRILNKRPFDVQLIGALTISEGKIAEMKTGEGKTLTAGIAATLNAIKGRTVFVVTVNDYLAQRDAEENMPLMQFFDLQVGLILSSIKDNSFKKFQYSKNIIYGTNSEFGFDYLRDNMVYSIEEKVQCFRDFVLIDEIDSILIDEARTPLIISGLQRETEVNFYEIDQLAKTLIEGKESEIRESFEYVKKTTGDFVLNHKSKSVFLTEEGISKIEAALNIDNAFLDYHTSKYIHAIEQSLIANHLFIEGKQYVIQENKIILIDESTGRLAIGRQLSNGLHQAIEAKEKVTISDSTATVAEISYQNYFNTFKTLSGMTGTAKTEEGEFLEIYKLDVISIPTNKPVKREDRKDLIFLNEQAKIKYLLKEVKEIHSKGQPILIGTNSVAQNNKLEEILTKEGFTIEVLNAKNAARESEIIAKAGEFNAITLATNMAGRGVDIKVSEESLKVGGLYVIGFERYENRRIDNQLRGRSGRQGDVGVSQFYISLEDPLIKIFGEDKNETKFKVLMQRVGFKEEDVIESSMVTKSISKAQKRIEDMHFEGRKDLLKFDNVISTQRKEIYNIRDSILINFDYKNRVNDLIDFVVNKIFDHGEFTTSETISENLFELLKLQFTEKLPENKDILTQFIKTVIWDKFAVLNEEQQLHYVRMFYLQTLDEKWIAHLTEIDNLKAGINLRQINQKDPVTEFQKESYYMFLHLIDDIKVNIVKVLFHLEFKITENMSEEIEEIDLDNLPK